MLQDTNSIYKNQFCLYVLAMDNLKRKLRFILALERIKHLGKIQQIKFKTYSLKTAKASQNTLKTSQKN